MFRKVIPPAIYKAIKPSVKVAQKVYFSILDGIESSLNLRDPLVPPRSQVFIGGGDFKKTGIEFKDHFVKIGGLKPDEKVLDVGSGIGRIAAALTTYLAKEGTYDGFDIVEQGINWSKENISVRYPNFRFQLADIHNDHYNPKGYYKASEYVFPYENEQFDFVFLTSVFTHMPKLEVDRYISEISRVLKPGGRAFITFFLLNDESRKLMTSSKSAHNIKYYVDGRYIAYPDDPEVCVGFDESYVINILKKNGMSAAIYPGAWCGRSSYTSFQDIVVARKG